MNPFDNLPRRIAVIDPSIRIGSTVARQMVNASQALERMRTGLYQEHYENGEFVGIIFSPQTARPAKLFYHPEEFGPIELPGLKFIQPSNAKPLSERTVTPYTYL